MPPPFTSSSKAPSGRVCGPTDLLFATAKACLSCTIYGYSCRIRAEVQVLGIGTAVVEHLLHPMAG
jgi:hypothetical protein